MTLRQAQGSVGAAQVSAGAVRSAAPTDLAAHDRGIVASLARLVGRGISRRGFLTSAALTGSAVTVGGLDFVLRPQDAYGAICGPAQSCQSGWTAFCCSINKGVNQCPPGSFAGGWWKADGASMCGGRARYIVDCQAKCECGCGNGSAFCGEKCWNCKPGCADDACDHRRYCRNVFRYGQCRQDITCSGPVMCRAMSCTPPWEWADCSTASATDNRTVAHNATCLPSWSPMQARYTQLGSQGSALGASVRAATAIRGGRTQRFTEGQMYWSKVTGAHYLRGRILVKYRKLGQSRSSLGFPTSDSHPVTGGFGATFQQGGIYAVADGSACVMTKRVNDAWLASGGADGPAGLPITDQKAIRSPAGQMVRTQQGSVFRGAGLTAHVLWGPVNDKYFALQDCRGALGYPLSSPIDARDVDGQPCTFALFQRGTIVARAGGATAAVWLSLIHI